MNPRVLPIKIYRDAIGIQNLTSTSPPQSQHILQIVALHQSQADPFISSSEKAAMAHTPQLRQACPAPG